MLHLLFPYDAFLLHQTILTQNTQYTIKHHTQTHIHFTTFNVKLYNSKHTNTTPITMLTSGFFNRNNSAQQFVNMPEHGVCSLHGLLLSLHVIDKACCCYNTGCTLTAVRVENSFCFSPLPSKSLLQTPRWAQGIIYTFLPIFLSDKI